MNKKKLQVWLPLLFSITLIAGMYLGYTMRDAMPGKSFFYRQKTKPVQEILDLVKNKYVDGVDMDTLTDRAIDAILAKLDPHSIFIPAEELDRVNEDMAGSFYGIGIEYNFFSDTINVLNVLKDGPGFKAGLQTGDKLLKVGDSNIAGRKMNIDLVRKLFRGDKGSKLQITALRGTTQQTFTVERDIIPVNSVDASYMIGSDMGYIRLNKFTQNAYREFMTALDTLHGRGMKKLILDLRGNGGGLLDQATAIADEFLDRDKLITYTEGKHSPKKEYRCQKEGMFEKEPLVVLADEGTASASEVLIGALQDWDRATIIGRRSFGKGLVQQQYDLSDGSALRLTIARYYTPAGRSIQRPYNNGEADYFDEVNRRFHDGEVISADSIKHDPKNIFKTLVNGKTVYGGGGITPDIFVAYDTTGMSPALSKIYAKGTLSDFAYHYFLQKKAELGTYKTPAQFTNGFVFSEGDWQQFTLEAAKDSVQLTNIAANEKAKLINRIKSNLSRQLWRLEGYYETNNAFDDAVKKAVEVLTAASQK